MSPFKDFDLDIVKVTTASSVSPMDEDKTFSEDCGSLRCTESCHDYTISCPTDACIESVDYCEG